MLSNVGLKDKRLSFKAKGILAYMLSLPDDWVFYETEIIKHATDGKQSLRSGLKELQETGYLVKHQSREKGKFSNVEWVISDEPNLDITTFVPSTTFTSTEKPTTEKPSTDNRPLLNTNNTKYLNELNTNNNNNTLSSKHDSIPYQEIIEYLNEKTGSQYRHTTQATRNGIKARYNEGFKLDDFKRVIDIKTSQWLYDTKMKQYLRPQTLFGTKFEAYLNEQPNVYQFEDSMKRDEKEPTPEEIAEFEKAREQFDKYKRTYAQNQS